MALENPRTAILVIVNKLGHIALSIADVGQPLGTVSDCVSFRPGLQRSCFLFKNIVEKLLRSVRPVNFLRRFQQVESKLMAVGVKKIMAASGQAIDHLRATHLLRPTLRIEVPVAWERETLLLDAHVP